MSEITGTSTWTHPYTSGEEILLIASNESASSSANLAVEEADESSLFGLGHTNENILLTLVYLAIFLIGVVGNVCNCLVIADSRNKYMKTATNYYLFSLSVSDLLLLIFGLPHDLVNLWHPSPYLFNQFVCISRGWISEASTYASVLVIVAFTVERYLAICHPLRTQTMSRLSRSVKIIILIWLVASSCALLVVLEYGVISVPIDKHDASGQIQVPVIQCTTVTRNETLFELSVVIFFIIPMAVITILYVRLGYHLRCKTRAIKEARKRTQQNLQTSKQANLRLDTSHSNDGLEHCQTELEAAKEDRERRLSNAAVTTTPNDFNCRLNDDKSLVSAAISESCSPSVVANVGGSEQIVSLEQVNSLRKGVSVASIDPSIKSVQSTQSANSDPDHLYLNLHLHLQSNSSSILSQSNSSAHIESENLTEKGREVCDTLRLPATTTSRRKKMKRSKRESLTSRAPPPPQQTEPVNSGKHQPGLSSNVNTANMQSVTKMLGKSS